MEPQARILVVDDDEASRRLVAELLTAQGYKVQTAANGHQAWQQWQEGAGAYALVLTDLQMPGVDGLALLAQIQATVPGTPVILLTGTWDATLRAQAHQLGAFAVLPKPFALTPFMDTVAHAVAAPPRAAATGGARGPSGVSAA
jgi:CheY-like chemotaxis protein